MAIMFTNKDATQTLSFGFEPDENTPFNFIDVVIHFRVNDRQKIKEPVGVDAYGWDEDNTYPIKDKPKINLKDVQQYEFRRELIRNWVASHYKNAKYLGEQYSDPEVENYSPIID